MVRTATIMAVWFQCGEEQTRADRVAMRWARSQIQNLPDKMESLMRALILGGALGLRYESLISSSNAWGAVQAVLANPDMKQTADLIDRAGWFDPGFSLHNSLARVLRGMLQNPARVPAVLSDIVLPLRHKSDGDPLLANPFYGVGAQKSREITTGAAGPKDLTNYLNKVAINKARDALRKQRKDESRQVTPGLDDDGQSRDPFERIPAQHDTGHVEKAALLNMLDPSHPAGKIVYDAIMAAANQFYGSKRRQSPSDVDPPGIQYFKMAFDSIKHGKLPSRTEVAKNIRTPATDNETRRVRDVALGMHERSLTQRHIQPILEIFAQHWDSNHNVQKQLLEILRKEGVPREQAENAIENMDEFVDKVMG